MSTRRRLAGFTLIERRTACRQGNTDFEVALTVAPTPNPNFLRVDAQVSRTFVTDVRGFAFELTPYFKILNALDRRDALFYHFDRSQQDPQARAVAALPVLPIIGLEWRF